MGIVPVRIVGKLYYYSLEQYEILKENNPAHYNKDYIIRESKCNEIDFNCHNWVEDVSNEKKFRRALKLLHKV